MQNAFAHTGLVDEHLLSFWSKVVEQNTRFLDPPSLKFAIKTWNDEKLDGRSNL